MELRKSAILCVFALIISTGVQAVRPKSSKLCKAAGTGDIDGVLACLRRGDAVNGDDGKTGMTPLAHAACEDYPGIVELLVRDFGADPNLPDNQGITPMARLIGRPIEEMVRMYACLRDCGAPVRGADGQSLVGEFFADFERKRTREAELMRAPKWRKRSRSAAEALKMVPSAELPAPPL